MSQTFEKDPTELRNIYRQRADLAAMMRATLERMSPSAAVVHDSGDLNPEAAERLAALGYVGRTHGVHHDYPGELLDDPKDCISAYNSILRNNRTFAPPVLTCAAAWSWRRWRNSAAVSSRPQRRFRFLAAVFRAPPVLLGRAVRFAAPFRVAGFRAGAGMPRNRTPLGASR